LTKFFPAGNSNVMLPDEMSIPPGGAILEVAFLFDEIIL
jgi:hypothetical protein